MANQDAHHTRIVDEVKHGGFVLLNHPFSKLWSFEMQIYKVLKIYLNDVRI